MCMYLYIYIYVYIRHIYLDVVRVSGLKPPYNWEVLRYTRVINQESGILATAMSGFFMLRTVCSVNLVYVMGVFENMASPCAAKIVTGKTMEKIDQTSGLRGDPF